MRSVKTFLYALWSDESAQGLTEYAMIVGAIVFTAVVTFLMMGDRLKGILGSMQGQLNDVPTS